MTVDQTYQASLRVKSTKWLLLIILALAAGLVATLGRQLSSLRAEHARLTMSLVGAQPGMFVAEYEGPSTNGSMLSFGSPMSGARQVLFVYNTTCSYCEATIAAWQQIADDLALDETVQVVGISLDADSITHRYSTTHSLRFQSVSLTDPRLIAMQRFQTVPQTLIVESGGRIVHARVGQIESGIPADSVASAARASNRSAVPR